MAKLVRTGPGGFPARNTANAAIRFAKPAATNEATLSLDIAATSLMETHYNLHGVDDITLEEAVSMLSESELRMLTEGTKDRIVIRAGKKEMILRPPVR